MTRGNFLRGALAVALLPVFDRMPMTTLVRLAYPDAPFPWYETDDQELAALRGHLGDGAGEWM